MRPFELSPDELKKNLEKMVDATISDLGSEFLLMPEGPAFLNYDDLRDGYEVLKKATHAFLDFTQARIFDAVLQNSRASCVLRSMLGMTPPEWAELAKSQYHVVIPQNAARILDRRCREEVPYVQRLETKYQHQVARCKEKGLPQPERPTSLERIDALIKTAAHFLTKGAPKAAEGLVHRMAKFDSSHGIESLQYAARENVPYAVLLYERYLGRPFAAHRDAVSELVGETIENAIEDYLRKRGVTYRKTQRAERIPGFGQARDFCIPDEMNPAVVIEAKLTSDDGTARDKVARIKELETQRNQHVAEGRPHYEVVACIDGRGFRERERKICARCSCGWMARCSPWRPWTD